MASFGFAAICAVLLFSTLVRTQPIENLARVITRAEDLNDTYDYVIVGGGTSGLTVADRLTEDGTSEIWHIGFCEYLTDISTRVRVSRGIWLFGKQSRYLAASYRVDQFPS
jgi:hypothetical protein